MIRQLLLSTGLCSILFFAGCYNSTMIRPTLKQTDSYVETHPDLSQLDRDCIEDGRFEVGMSAETVRFLLGEPKEIEIVQQPWAKQEKWTYHKGGGSKVFYMEDKGVVAIEEAK